MPELEAEVPEADAEADAVGLELVLALAVGDEVPAVDIQVEGRGLPAT